MSFCIAHWARFEAHKIDVHTLLKQPVVRSGDSCLSPWLKSTAADVDSSRTPRSYLHMC